jgi:hypothetical protein
VCWWSKDGLGCEAPDYAGVDLVVNIVHSLLVNIASLAFRHLLKQIFLEVLELYALQLLVEIVLLVHREKPLDIILSIRSGPMVNLLFSFMSIFHLLHLEFFGLVGDVPSGVWFDIFVIFILLLLLLKISYYSLFVLFDLVLLTLKCFTFKVFSSLVSLVSEHEALMSLVCKHDVHEVIDLRYFTHLLAVDWTQDHTCGRRILHFVKDVNWIDLQGSRSVGFKPTHTPFLNLFLSTVSFSLTLICQLVQVEGGISLVLSEEISLLLGFIVFDLLTVHLQLLHILYHTHLLPGFMFGLRLRLGKAFAVYLLKLRSVVILLLLIGLDGFVVRISDLLSDLLVFVVGVVADSLLFKLLDFQVLSHLLL